MPVGCAYHGYLFLKSLDFLRVRMIPAGPPPGGLALPAPRGSSPSQGPASDLPGLKASVFEKVRARGAL